MSCRVYVVFHSFKLPWAPKLDCKVESGMVDIKSMRMEYVHHSRINNEHSWEDLHDQFNIYILIHVYIHTYLLTYLLLPPIIFPSQLLLWTWYDNFCDLRLLARWNTSRILIYGCWVPDATLIVTISACDYLELRTQCNNVFFPKFQIFN